MTTEQIKGEKNQKRVLVISGGGSRGAWGGGLIKKIYEEEQPDYRCIVGNSTGSLLGPLVAINAFEKMEKGFTDVDQEAIFDSNPFKEDGNIRFFNAVIKILFGSANLGKTEKLKERILSFFTEDDFTELKKTGRTVKASVVSLTSNEVKFKSTDDHVYSDMVEWIWASANQPLFMSTLFKDDELWVDGGLKENVPIAEGLRYAKEHNIDVVDVVVNNQNGVKENRWPEENKKANIIPKLLRTIDIFSDEVRQSDIIGGILDAQVNNKFINIYYMSKEEYGLSPQSLLFKKHILKDLWKRGYEHKVLKFFSIIELPGNNFINFR